MMNKSHCDIDEIVKDLLQDEDEKCGDVFSHHAVW